MNILAGHWHHENGSWTHVMVPGVAITHDGRDFRVETEHTLMRVASFAQAKLLVEDIALAGSFGKAA